MSQGPRILLIDENPQDRDLAAVVLDRDIPGARIEAIDSAAGFARALRASAPDLVVTEDELSWSTGMQILQSVRDSRPDTPVVVFTTLSDGERAVEAMKAGLDDYVIKSSKGYLKLPQAAREALERATDKRLVARASPWLETLLDRANLGAFRSTLDQSLIESNAALLRLLGVSSIQQALNLDLPASYFQREARAELFEGLSKQGRVHSRQIEYTRPDGKTLWLSLTELLLLDIDGDIVTDVLVQDVTDRASRELELSRRLESLERSNEDLSEFASIASHELREPLRMVAQYGRLLGQSLGGRLGDEDGESLAFMLDGVRRMDTLIDDLLRFARINSEGQAFRTCDCNALVDRAVRSLRGELERSQAEIRREQLPTILADASQFYQVFHNLLSNALKFSGEGRPRVRVTVGRRGEFWVFSVRDNGIGVHPDDQDKLFAIFHRLNPEMPGTGIGLSLCKRIVERHGGRIWVESKPGEGATFSFTVPVSGQQEGDDEMSPPHVMGSLA